MPKKKVKKSTAKKVSVKKITPRTSSSQGFFQEHKNLKWLLPLLAIALLGLFLIHRHVKEEISGSERQSTKEQLKDSIKNEIKEKLRIENTTSTDTQGTTTF